MARHPRLKSNRGGARPGSGRPRKDGLPLGSGRAKKKTSGKMGGKRIGAGRRVGSTNKYSREMIDKCKAEGYMPLEYMLRVMRDARATKPRRDWAAASAAPYLHHRLASIQHTGVKGGPITLVNLSMSARQAAEAFASTMMGIVEEEATLIPLLTDDDPAID